MASFPLFSSFPVEIQLAIWAFAAILDPEPEVCLAWPLNINEYNRPPEQPALPFTVDTAWPTVAHVCRAARDAALNSGAIQLRHSSLAGFAVPFRHFIPAIDTLYWGQFQAGAMYLFLKEPENANIARDLRHISLDLTGWYPLSDLAELIRQRAVDLCTLSMVLPNTANLPSASLKFLPPTRRCRLRTIPDSALDEITIARVAFLRAGESEPMSLRKYLEKQRGALDRHVRGWPVHGPEGTAWSSKENSFSGLDVMAQTFVEYRCALLGDNREQWIEARNLENRLSASPQDDAAPNPRHIPVASRKNPEEYRVHDDDSSWYSYEEFIEDTGRLHG